MSKRMRTISFLIILSFVSIALWLSADNLFAQRPDNKATTQLAVLSEDFSSDDIEEINSLILANADVNVRNKYDVTPLFIASQNGYTEIVIMLLTANADVDTATKKDGYTALSVASKEGHTEIVTLLQEAGATIK